MTFVRLLLFVSSPMSQKTGILLNKPWPYKSGIKGKAVILLGLMTSAAELTTSLFMGALIEFFNSSSIFYYVPHWNLTSNTEPMVCSDEAPVIIRGI